MADAPPKIIRPDLSKLAEIPTYDEAGTAKGRLWTTDGKPLTDICGAGDGPATDGVDLKEPWKSHSTMTWHVEGHAAAIMRERKIEHAVLYLNAGPCKKPRSSDRAIRGCLETLSDVLPKDYILTVIFRNPSGMVQKRDFNGNGRGLGERNG